MKAYQIIKKYIDDNGIMMSHVADEIAMPRELLQRSLDGTRILKSDEFIRICRYLSLDLDQFEEDKNILTEIV